MDKTENIETWNKKRIIIAIAIITLLIIGGILLKNSILGTKFSPSSFLKSVKGVSSQKVDKPVPLPIKATIQEKLDTIKKDINSLNIVDIASSSPQVQKIINDLNSIKDYPKNEAKDLCQKICGGL